MTENGGPQICVAVSQILCCLCVEVLCAFRRDSTPLLMRLAVAYARLLSFLIVECIIFCLFQIIGKLDPPNYK